MVQVTTIEGSTSEHLISNAWSSETHRRTKVVLGRPRGALGIRGGGREKPMITATAVLEEFPAEFKRLTVHDNDTDAIGWSQLIAYSLLVGTAVRALRSGKLWTDMPSNERERNRELAVRFIAAANDWEKTPLSERWSSLRQKPRETIAVNLLFPKTRTLAKAILECATRDDDRASYVSSLYAAAPATIANDNADGAYISLTSEQIRNRAW